MRHVLLIVHYFPPMGGGAVMRALKFAKYLPQFGWTPIVLSVDEAYYHPDGMDHGLLSELPKQVVVYRTPCLKPRQQTKVSLKGGDTARHRAGRAIVGCKRWLYDRFLVFQDEGFLWHPYAIPAIRRIVQRHSIDAVLTTSPPHNTQLLGALAQRAAHVPWVADFRDGWTDDPLFHSRFAPRNALERWLERQVITSADAVVSATEEYQQWFAGRYGAPFLAKSTVIFNGFDPADLPATSASRPETTGALSIAHVGSIGGTRSLPCFLQAVKHLPERDGASLPDIRVEFVGAIYTEERDLVAKTPGVVLTGHLPHRQAVERMLGADVLLLVTAPEATQLPGKLFEYVAAQRPILALTASEYLAEFIEREQLGVVARPDDQRQIEDALIRLCEKKRAGRLALPPNPALLARFNRRDQARKLAEVLEGLVA